MKYFEMVSRLFPLFRTYLDSNGKDKKVLEEQIKFLLQQEITDRESVPAEIQEKAAKLFSLYNKMRKNHEAELLDELYDIFNDLKVYLETNGANVSNA